MILWIQVKYSFKYEKTPAVTVWRLSAEVLKSNNNKPHHYLTTIDPLCKQ